ncbi:hypothetical protein L2E82_20407 [Cichorium intybus]|uniref:Uncharacterized protein n=1 Tax=Cichorium intybus TaxID=13427 RepID=A0ACB9DTM4_CICIN|nr:hypothetical protein L2E82_20407 [Cichorium intybus]
MDSIAYILDRLLLNCWIASVWTENQSSNRRWIRAIGASRQLAFESVPDLEKSMYMVMDGYPCVRLLNLSGEIGCANPGLDKVVATIIRFKNGIDFVKPSSVVVPLSDFDNLLSRVSSDSKFAKNLAGVLVESGPQNQTPTTGNRDLIAVKNENKETHATKVTEFDLEMQVPNYTVCGRCWDIVYRYKVTIFYTAPTLMRLLCVACPSEFVIPLTRYRTSVFGTQLPVGMRFGMMFETDELGKHRYMGTIVGISDLDPLTWPDSKWHNERLHHLEIGFKIREK